MEGDDSEARASVTSELATYLWENYIEYLFFRILT